MKKFYAFLFAAAVGVCASNAASVPLTGEGTQASPYQITSAADWNSLATYVTDSTDGLDGKYVKIMNNIDFTDVTVTPLGYYSASATKRIGFGGILQGNNCTLSGINFTPKATYQGMIGYLKSGGEVSDLTIEGTVTSTVNFTGGFFGRMNGKASNCTNKLNVTSTKGYVGGFAAFADTDAEFVNCNNYGAIEGVTGYVGGFVGQGQKGISLTGCTNYGKVTLNSTDTKYKNAAGLVAYGYAATYTNCDNRGEVVSQAGSSVGGIAGYVMSTGNIVFTNCNNYAPITGNSLVGGLLGSTVEGTNAKCYIIADNCHNYGAITSTQKTKNGTGGLLGAITTGSQITNCHNEGTITSTSASYAGGIWGAYFVTTKDSAQIIIENCYNTGDVTNGGNYAGGLGTILRFTHITNCYNTGNISAAICAGGLGSTMGDDVYIDKCWNSGDCKTTSKAGAGGLLAIANNRVYVTNSFNTGDVYALSNNAGGLAGTGRPKLTNCYNRGNVSAGVHTAGGLIGQASNNTGSTVNHGATMINCYNAGMISTPNDSLIGNLVGNTDYWVTEKGCELTDCYYVSDYYGKTSDADAIGGTAVTVKELAAMTSMPGDWTYGDAYTYPMIKGLENECAQAFAVAVVLADGDTYDNVTTSFTLGEQDAIEWTSSTDSILITDYAFIGGPIDKMSQAVVMTASAADGKFQALWYLTVNAEKAATSIEENELTDRVLTSSRYYDITGAQVTTPAAGNLYIRLNKYNDGTQSASKVRF